MRMTHVRGAATHLAKSTCQAASTDCVLEGAAAAPSLFPLIGWTSSPKLMSEESGSLRGRYLLARTLNKEGT